ncbi:MAG: hypothetical protein K1Y36_22260 [Blastocatellia bacterium]|nr:hypothetical protein [Blastocatellia bacterium]
MEVTLPEEEYGSIEILVREKVLEKFEKEVKDCLIAYLQKKDDIWKKIRESFLKKESRPEKKQVKKKVKPEGLFS